jgi:choline dehydrogenase
MTNYIIVGSGTAGCVLANRLSANPDVRVTLLEAGAADSHFFYRMPAGYFGLMKSGRGNWKFETPSQAGLNGRSMYVPRGKVVGGSSMINALVWVRGNSRDFDQWARMGNTGWSYADLLPYFRLIESYEGGASEFRGGSGPIKVTAGPQPENMTPISRAWIEASRQAGYPYNPDVNGRSQEGFGPASGTFAAGLRQSAASCYLEPAIRRPNLTLITDALATRILLDNGKAIGVEYVRNGRINKLHADAEVIISGGAINSPQLLQLSGIGDPSLLRAHGIKVECDLPGVGENLQDHLSVSVRQEITNPYSALQYVQPWKAIRSLLQYLLLNSGPATTNGLEAMAFVKSRPEMECPDIQYHLPLLMYTDYGRKIIQKEGFLAHATGCHPESRGSVRIFSSDPTIPPVIDPHYLEHPEDLRVLRDSIRIARELIAQPAFDDFRGPEYGPGKAAKSDADLDDYIRNTAESVYHHSGTCKMGNDEMAVVDNQLRVRGVEKLRVVDASVFPRIITGNIMAATYVVAEKAADMILGKSSCATA